MLRNILSILGGLITGILFIFIIEGVAHALYPPPSGIDLRDPAVFKEFISTLPVAAGLLILTAYAAGSFFGGLVASLIAVRMKLSKAITIGGILMGLGMFNMITLGHPLWMILFGIVVFVPFSYLGGYMGVKLSHRKRME
ncbi:MAG: hypothetical protein M3R27_13815 [Bacteroidota bacterium]|nr:hypothetical protein [Bacteroidota bacterium]